MFSLPFKIPNSVCLNISTSKPKIAVIYKKVLGNISLLQAFITFHFRRHIMFQIYNRKSVRCNMVKMGKQMNMLTDVSSSSGLVCTSIRSEKIFGSSELFPPIYVIPAAAFVRFLTLYMNGVLHMAKSCELKFCKLVVEWAIHVCIIEGNALSKLALWQWEAKT